MDFLAHHKIASIRSGESDEIVALSALQNNQPRLLLAERPAVEGRRIRMPIVLTADEVRAALDVLRQGGVSHVALGNEDHPRTLEIGRNESGTGIEMIATDPEVVAFGQTTFEAHITDGHDLRDLIEIFEYCLDLEHQIVSTPSAKP